MILLMTVINFSVSTDFDSYSIDHFFVGLQVLKGKKISLSCDVFSYGMVLFEIFKLEIPFSGVTEMEVIVKSLQGEVGNCPLATK